MKKFCLTSSTDHRTAIKTHEKINHDELENSVD